MQVDPKFLRNMRFAKKHNRQGLKRQRKEQQEPMEPWLLVVDWVFAIIIYICAVYGNDVTRRRHVLAWSYRLVNWRCSDSSVSAMEKRGSARLHLLEERLAAQIAELKADLTGRDLQAAARSGRWGAFAVCNFFYCDLRVSCVSALDRYGSISWSGIPIPWWSRYLPAGAVELGRRRWFIRYHGNIALSCNYINTRAMYLIQLGQGNWQIYELFTHVHFIHAHSCICMQFTGQNKKCWRV